MREALTGPDRLALKATATRWQFTRVPADGRKLADAFAALMDERDRLADQAAGRDATIQRVRDVHERQNSVHGKVCGSCRDAYEDPVKWPCVTIRALDGDPGDDGSRADG